MSKMSTEKKLLTFLPVVICSATAVAQDGAMKFQSDLEALHQKWVAAFPRSGHRYPSRNN